MRVLCVLSLQGYLSIGLSSFWELKSLYLLCRISQSLHQIDKLNVIARYSRLPFDLSYTTDTTGNRKLQYIQEKLTRKKTAEQKKKSSFNNGNFQVMQTKFNA